MKSSLFFSAILLSGFFAGCNPQPAQPPTQPTFQPAPTAQQPSSEEDCKKGVAKACRFAATLYHQGIGGPPDGNKAAFYADIGCNSLSDYESCIILHHYKPSQELNEHIAMLAEGLRDQEEEKRQNWERHQEKKEQKSFANKVQQLSSVLADINPPWDAEKLRLYQRAVQVYERLAEHERAADHKDSLEKAKQRLNKLQRSAEVAQKKFEAAQKKLERQRRANEDKLGEKAAIIAWKAIYRRLKAPSTANLISAGYEIAPNGIFMVRLVADAQNGFGAMIRSGFQVFVDVDRNIAVMGDEILWRSCVRTGNCSGIESMMSNPMDRIN